VVLSKLDIIISSCTTAGLRAIVERKIQTGLTAGLSGYLFNKLHVAKS